MFEGGFRAAHTASICDIAVIAKTTSERVQALHQRRDALGLTRLEPYVLPDDHEAKKAHAAKLATL